MERELCRRRGRRGGRRLHPQTPAVLSRRATDRGRQPPAAGVSRRSRRRVRPRVGRPPLRRDPTAPVSTASGWDRRTHDSRGSSRLRAGVTSRCRSTSASRRGTVSRATSAYPTSCSRSCCACSVTPASPGPPSAPVGRSAPGTSNEPRHVDRMAPAVGLRPRRGQALRRERACVRAVADRSMHALRGLYPVEEDRYLRLSVERNRDIIGWALVLDTQMSDAKYFGDARWLDCGLPCRARRFRSSCWQPTEYLSRRKSIDRLQPASSAVGVALKSAGYERGPLQLLLLLLARDCRSTRASEQGVGGSDSPQPDGDGEGRRWRVLISDRPVLVPHCALSHSVRGRAATHRTRDRRVFT